MVSSQDYDTLCERLKEISTLNGVSGLLMWDEMVLPNLSSSSIHAAMDISIVC